MIRPRQSCAAATLSVAAFLFAASYLIAQRIEVTQDPDGITVFRATALGLSAEAKDFTVAAGPEVWRTLLEVRIGDSTAADSGPRLDVPALAGRYTFIDGRVEFRPRYPLQPGLTYWAIPRCDALAALLAKQGIAWQPSAAGGPERHRHDVPTVDSQSTATVTQIFPSADTLPENQLKFYIHFSVPMQQGDAYRHVKLYDDAGALVELPFLELSEELWDRDGMRFTLFIDPGRIKQGVKPREDLGSALVEGKRFTLVVETSWPDAVGRKMQAEFRKEFVVAAADHASPRPGNWRLHVPRAGSRDPLVVDFGEPLDHALVQRLVWVHATDDAKLAGIATIASGERHWQFVPAAPWVAGDHVVVAGTALEDLAGNSIARPFDRDLAAGTPQHEAEKLVRVPFVVK